MLPSIYKLTLLNDTESYKRGIVYIGQHNGNSSKYFTGGVLPRRIIKKYGKDVFKKEIISTGKYNKALLDELEIHYIRLYNSNNVGLNISAGGKTGGISLKKVHQYNLEGVYLKTFNSAEEATKLYGGFKSNIAKAASLNNGENVVVGYRWLYVKVKKLNPHKTYIKLYQYSLTGEYLNEYNSISEASKKYPIKSLSNKIWDCLDKVGNSGYGYQWRTYKVGNCGIYKRYTGHNVRL